MPRYFTLEEARASLPLIRDLLAGIQERKRRLDEVQGRIEEARAKVRGNGHLGSVPLHGGASDLDRLVREIQEGVRRIQDRGILVKDLDAGLVDWPSLREGREVYLCWRLGEPDILYWHEVADGFRGRQRLEEP